MNHAQPLPPADEATLEDVDRLMELQELVKQTYAEIGRLKKKIKATVVRRQQQQAELRRRQEARERSLAREYDD